MDSDIAGVSAWRVSWPVPAEQEAAAVAGQHVLIATGGFGQLDNGRFTPLPGSSTTLAAW
ncbi:MAG TPA: hypothetical protein VGI74_06605 [Streptosporangiaceae bacterium]|jgi:hypothetical protein